MIGAIWVNHHAMFDRIAEVDWGLLFLNTVFLGAMAFLPLPTRVLAAALHAHHGEPAAMFFYGVLFALSGAAVVAMWTYARRRGQLEESISDDQARAIGRRYLVGPSLYTVSALIGLAAPIVSLVLYAFLVMFFWYPDRRLANGPSAPGDASQPDQA